MGLEDVEIAHEQEAHVAVVLLLDASGSMENNSKIYQLNEAVKCFKQDVLSDDLARKRVEIAVVSFGGDVNIHHFSSVEEFEAPTLEASGRTPMGTAILRAIDLVEQRKTVYKKKGMSYYRPWIFMITDGKATDMEPGDLKWNEVIKKVHEGNDNKNKKFLFFTVGVEPADMAILKLIAPPGREVVELKQDMFKEMFSWLSTSLSAISNSNDIGEQIAMENPTAPNGWGKIPTD